MYKGIFFAYFFRKLINCSRARVFQPNYIKYIKYDSKTKVKDPKVKEKMPTGFSVVWSGIMEQNSFCETTQHNGTIGRGRHSLF